MLHTCLAVFLDIRKTLIIVAVSVFVITGCSDPNDAKKENFSKAINDYIGQQRACLKIGSRYLDKAIYTEYTSLNALVKAGMLQNKRLKTNDRVSPTVLYSLTEQGKNASKTKKGLMGGVTLLCYGDMVLEEVLSFTPPASMRDGYTVSHVKYTYKVENIEDWVNNEALMKEYKNIKDELDSGNTPLQDDAALILTSTGWVHERLHK